MTVIFPHFPPTTRRVILSVVILALILLILATLVSGMVAYGTHPYWAQFHHGIEFIAMARRLEWPLIAAAIVLAAFLLALVIGGKRRAWWLIGLAPLLALFVHRFAIDQDAAFRVNRQPTFVSADVPGDGEYLGDDAYVVGLTYHGQSWAYPYALLYPSPLVVQVEQEHPLLLMWSPFANRAVALGIDRSIKPVEMEVVSMPANTLLVYNARVGQFINGFTGKMLDGEKPSGVIETIPTLKTTWKNWKMLHPATQVMQPSLPAQAMQPTFPAYHNLPTRPVLPMYPMPPSTRPSESTVALLSGENSVNPLAIDDEDMSPEPATVPAGEQTLLLLRQPDGMLKAFSRLVPPDYYLIFRQKTDSKFPAAILLDTNTASLWNAEGVAIDGPLKGTRLKAVDIDDGVYLRVAQFWYPHLTLVEPTAVPDYAPEPSTVPGTTHRRTTHRRRAATPQ